MSDMRDPRLDPSHPDYRGSRERDLRRDDLTREGMNWSWILGGIAALVLLLLGVSYWSSSDPQTAGDTTPPTTTGQSAPPANPPATTGQAPRPAPSPTPPSGAN